ncbi:MAG: hypothetical protein DID90_2727554384 [Candidatus Nitrotoga sp. LAW]|nr:MAG: hypothetical protein DID90_2727554384 [Candidatus Nitrotoga sp. LAW]
MTTVAGRVARRAADELQRAHRLWLQHRRIPFRSYFTSMHGWLWIIAALPSNWLNIRLRKVFCVE